MLSTLRLKGVWVKPQTHINTALLLKVWNSNDLFNSQLNHGESYLYATIAEW